MDSKLTCKHPFHLLACLYAFKIGKKKIRSSQLHGSRARECVKKVMNLPASILMAGKWLRIAGRRSSSLPFLNPPFPVVTKLK